MLEEPGRVETGVIPDDIYHGEASKLVLQLAHAVLEEGEFLFLAEGKRAIGVVFFVLSNEDALSEAELIANAVGRPGGAQFLDRSEMDHVVIAEFGRDGEALAPGADGSRYAFDNHGLEADCVEWERIINDFECGFNDEATDIGASWDQPSWRCTGTIFRSGAGGGGGVGGGRW